MLSLCSSTPFLRLSKPPLLPPFQHVHRSTPKLLPHRLKFPAVNASSSAMDFPSNSQPQQLRPRTPFPGGFKRPEIKIPTLVLQLDCEEVLRKDGTLDAVDVALSKWIGIIILSYGEESRGGQLYEAACVLKSVIRDRAYLLISERVDIAAAVGASGVLLSDKGLPAIVARNMMMESKAGSVVLPLVARTVETAKSALAASSSEGADFLILGIDRAKHAESFLNAVCEHVKVPVFIMIDLVEDATCFGVASELIQSGASGIVVCMKDIKLLTDDNLNKLFSTVYAMDSRAQDVFKAFNRGHKLDVDKALQGKRRVSGFYKDKERQFIEVERPVLLEAINFIHKAAPQMEEVSLLVDAVSRLDDPFLLVIVGEFNSGKSTVINALLGRRYLKEGVIPTTNEITLLCYSEMNSSEQQRCERHPDGQFICYLPAPILKEMNLVDTPGTNVILQRQQRLTEEFVPRADLLLFVMSADRPLTESEVAFLRYVQQWKKKVVFILNKSDIYQNISELEEATSFIKENTRKLLNTEHVTVYPVSARLALEAKLSASSHIGVDYEKFLSNDPNWRHSSFHEFEDFLFSFLDGSTDAGIERMKLKLETPIGITNRILTYCESFVRQEFEYANQDLMSIRDTINSLKEYAMKMENESTSWRKQILSLIERAKARAVKLMESSLQLSNLDLIATSFFKGEKSNSMRASLSVQNEIVGPALSDAQRLIVEYLAWLQSCNAREERRYKESFEKRWPAFVNNTDLACSEDCELIRRKKELSFQVTESFSPSAAAKLLDQEIREVVFGTFGGLGVAGLSASLLTSVLPSTLEDLLALGLCSAGGLLAISSFPNRRKELTDKVKRAADALARELEEAMTKDLSEALENLEQWVELIARPYQDAAQRRLNQMLILQEELSNVEKKIQALQIEIQNLHVLESV